MKELNALMIHPPDVAIESLLELFFYLALISWVDLVPSWQSGGMGTVGLVLPLNILHALVYL